MPDKPWKQWERDVAVVIQGKRHPSNSGGTVDCSGPEVLAQCKLVQRLSLEELTALAKLAADTGEKDGKVGVVGVKLKAGKGHPATGLICMTVEQFEFLMAGLGGEDLAKYHREKLIIRKLGDVVREQRRAFG